MDAAVQLALNHNAALAIAAKIRDKADKSVIWINLENTPVSKIAQTDARWTKPELVKLGTLKDVAGSQAINNDGPNNGKNPAPS